LTVGAGNLTVGYFWGVGGFVVGVDLGEIKVISDTTFKKMTLKVRIPKKSESPNALSSSAAQGASNYVGSYSADENGIQVKIMVGPNKWYGEVIEGRTGGLISNEGGDVSDNALYDQYGTEIGEIRGNSVIMSIQGQRVRLVRD
jgi:hypothetical protein